MVEDGGTDGSGVVVTPASGVEEDANGHQDGGHEKNPPLLSGSSVDVGSVEGKGVVVIVANVVGRAAGEGKCVVVVVANVVGSAAGVVTEVVPLTLSPSNPAATEAGVTTGELPSSLSFTSSGK